MFDRIPFRFKLFATGALALLTITAVFTFMQAALVESALTRQVLTRADAERPFFRAVLAHLLVERNYATIEAILQESASARGFAHLALIGPRGETIACVGWDPEKHGVPAEAPLPAIGPDGTPRLPFETRIEYAGQYLGTLYFGVSLLPVEAARAEVLRRATIIAGVSLLVALMMMEWLHALLMRPMMRLREASERVRQGDFDVDPHGYGGGDLGRLADSFRLMAAEIAARIRALEASEAAQRQLLDDAKLREKLLADARDRAEAAARSKARFLATMSHEIRTPLNGVLGLSSVLLDGRIEPEQRRMLQSIQESGEQLLRIVDDVLDFSRLDANKLNLDAAPFDPQRATREAAASFQSRAAAKNLVLTCWVDGNVPAQVQGDAARVRQILDNLIGNAVKFTPAGAIDVRLRATAGGALEWSVQDTGIGIPPARLPDLFQDFMQVDSSSARRFGGSGLGLAIARRLAILMGGDISVDSTVDRGSTFSVRLPLAALPAAASAAAETPAQVPDARTSARIVALPVRRGAGLFVLAAEDNEINRYVIEKLLTGMGHDVVFAADGQQAVEIAKVQKFDAILMDIQMPTLDGIAATRRIRESGGVNANIPIIALTANAMAGDRETYLAAGLTDFVPKPIDPHQLAAILAAVPRRMAPSAAIRH